MNSTLKGAVLLGVGILAGIALSIVSSDIMRRAEVGDIVKSTGIVFEHCEGADSASRKLCVNQAVLNEAVRTQNPATCQHISDEAMKADCSKRLSFISKLGAAAQTCVGLPAESLCYDTTALLAAAESRQVSQCNGISSIVLFNACQELVTGQRPVGSDSDAVASRSRYSYGLQCDSSDSLCAKNKAAFNIAVRSNNVEACKKLEIGAEQCVAEAVFYSAYQSGQYDACIRQFETDDICRTTVAIAKAVDAGDEALCNILAGANRDACQEVVRTNKEKRFEYLNEVL